MTEPRDAANIDHLQTQAVKALLDNFKRNIWDVPKVDGIAPNEVVKTLIEMSDTRLTKEQVSSLLDVHNVMYLSRLELKNGRATVRGLIFRRYKRISRTGETSEQHKKRISRIVSAYQRLCNRFEINSYFGTPNRFAYPT